MTPPPPPAEGGGEEQQNTQGVATRGGSHKRGRGHSGSNKENNHHQKASGGRGSNKKKKQSPRTAGTEPPAAAAAVAAALQPGASRRSTNHLTTEDAVIVHQGEDEEEVVAGDPKNLAEYAQLPVPEREQKFDWLLNHSMPSDEDGNEFTAMSSEDVLTVLSDLQTTATHYKKLNEDTTKRLDAAKKNAAKFENQSATLKRALEIADLNCKKQASWIDEDSLKKYILKLAKEKNITIDLFRGTIFLSKKPMTPAALLDSSNGPCRAGCNFVKALFRKVFAYLEQPPSNSLERNKMQQAPLNTYTNGQTHKYNNAEKIAILWSDKVFAKAYLKSYNQKRNQMACLYRKLFGKKEREKNYYAVSLLLCFLS